MEGKKTRPPFCFEIVNLKMGPHSTCLSVRLLLVISGTLSISKTCIARNRNPNMMGTELIVRCFGWLKSSLDSSFILLK